MISREQADGVADDLLDLARAENAKAPPAQPRNWFSRYSELEQFEPAQRSRALREATAWANRQWAVLAACFLWLVPGVGVPLFLLPEQWGGAAAIPVIFFAVPFVVIRRAYVRRYLVALLACPPGERWAAPTTPRA